MRRKFNLGLSINQLYFRQTSNKTAGNELSTATLSDWATRRTFCTNISLRPENRLKIQWNKTEKLVELKTVVKFWREFTRTDRRDPPACVSALPPEFRCTCLLKVSLRECKCVSCRRCLFHSKLVGCEGVRAFSPLADISSPKKSPSRTICPLAIARV